MYFNSAGREGKHAAMKEMDFVFGFLTMFFQPFNLVKSLVWLQQRWILVLMQLVKSENSMDDIFPEYQFMALHIITIQMKKGHCWVHNGYIIQFILILFFDHKYINFIFFTMYRTWGSSGSPCSWSSWVTAMDFSASNLPAPPAGYNMHCTGPQFTYQFGPK